MLLLPRNRPFDFQLKSGLTRLVISRDEHRPKTSVTTQDLPCGAVPFPPPDIRKCGCQKFEKFDGFRSASNHPTNIIHTRNIHIHICIYIYTHTLVGLHDSGYGWTSDKLSKPASHHLLPMITYAHTHILTHAYIYIFSIMLLHV